MPRFLLFSALILGAVVASASTTHTLYLSGRSSEDAVPWHFSCREGRGCGEWTTIPVPSNWELQGFGTYDYGITEKKARDQGDYRTFVHLPAAWRGRTIRLVFGGVMTDTEVWVNGELAGPPHQGGFYEFSYDVTERLRFDGVNVLDVRVAEHSANPSVNAAERDADYWTFGGIFRPVRLEASPPGGISSFAVDARPDGSLAVVAELAAGAPADATLRARVRPLAGGPALGELSGGPADDGALRVSGSIPGVEPWSGERPRLYQLEIVLESAGREIHRRSARIGFRTVELRPGRGLFINGTKVFLRGINRHSFWPSTGRTTADSVSRLDIERLLEMNVNAVRTAHYPPDEHFLDACDEAGIYVLDELAGWHDAYDTEVGEHLVEEMVRRDRLHPSVILWANGNEGGWNEALDDDFSRWDPQRRPVLHPDTRTDRLDTSHYPTWTEWVSMLDDAGLAGWWRRLRGQPRPLVLSTEVLHGLYDGGHGAGLERYWERLRRSPQGVGLFLWTLLDEAVVRTDQGGRLDGAGNRAPDGVLGPYREREGSVRALREAFSPIVSVGDPYQVAGRLVLPVENRFHFTDLDETTVDWKLLDLPGPWAEPVATVVANGRVRGPSIAPGHRGELTLTLPDDFRQRDALRIAILAPNGREVIDGVISLGATTETRSDSVSQSARGYEEDHSIRLEASGVTATIDAETGRLRSLARQGVELPLTDGPVAIRGRSRLQELRHGPDGDSYVVSIDLDGALEEIGWRMEPTGRLSLEYAYRHDGIEPIEGFGFTLPADAVRSARWVGTGPYRVWGNRLAGTLGVWSLAANDTVTGRSWLYPEFRGYHRAVRWLRLETTAGPLVFEIDGTIPFMQLLRPSPWPNPESATAPFADLDLAFLFRIPAIGTKFHHPDELAPRARKRDEQVARGRVIVSLAPQPE